ncbi:MAG: DNA-binding response regulator [Acidobacteria bacterium]|nr:MAG: DNA-binding response regulator [Acidobacteriota bacterium]
MKRRILIIEDDQDIARSIAYNLEREGDFDVKITGTGEEGLSYLLEHPPDLLILDVNLPHMSGFEICRRIRREAATAHLPIIMLTARVAETDRVLGLDLGADDYVTKPFSMRELMARVRAVIRRAQPESASTGYDDGLLRIDFESFRVSVAGRDVRLRPKEFELLKALVQNPGRVMTRHRLLDRVWHLDYHGSTRTLDVHIRRLRQKLGPAASMIETVTGIGYRFRPSPSPAERDHMIEKP